MIELTAPPIEGQFVVMWEHGGDIWSGVYKKVKNSRLKRYIQCDSCELDDFENESDCPSTFGDNVRYFMLGGDG